MNLPWFDFREMGLIVMTFQNKLGDVREAMVDMSKVVIARQFMSRQETCQVTGNSRTFYRFCNEIPFTPGLVTVIFPR